mgnify:CR=1 FL=1
MFADEGIINLKHEVLNMVAKLAFEGKLEEERDNIPYRIIPGPEPEFRCCIYKEREIIRQRVKLAEKIITVILWLCGFVWIGGRFCARARILLASGT